MIAGLAKIGYLSTLGGVGVVAASVATGVLSVETIRSFLPTDRTIERTVQPLVSKVPEQTQVAALPKTTDVPKKPETKPVPAVNEKPAVTTVISPAFGVLRVEKDGSILVAGSAQPNQTVELLDAEGSVLGKTVAGDSGDFVILPNQFLKPGDYVLNLQTVRKDKTKIPSTQTAVVRIPDRGDENVLALISTDGEASKIVAKPKALEKQEVATLVKPAAPEPEPEKTVEAVAEPAPKVITPQPPEPEKEQVEIKQLEPASQEQEIALATPAKPEAKPESVEVPVVEVPVAVVPTTKIEQPAKTEPLAPQQVQPKPAAKAEAPTVQVIIEAVEVEGPQVFVAGAVPKGKFVRIYIDNIPVGDGRGTKDDRFLVSRELKLAEGQHVVRADVVDRKTGKVIARAEVPLLHEVPREAVAVATAQPAKPSVPVENVVVPVPETKQPVPTANTQTEIATLSNQKSLTDVAAATKRSVVEAAKPDPDPVAKQTAPKAVVESKPKTKKLAATKPAPAVVQSAPTLEPVEKSIAAQTPPPPPVIATAFDSGQTGVIRTGRAIIIKPGDNLWRISRRTYGRGIRYTTIYNANKNQIRNPNRIYIGQIFKIPQTHVE